MSLSYSFWINPSDVREALQNKNQLSHQQVGSTYSKFLQVYSKHMPRHVGPNTELSAALLVKENLAQSSCSISHWPVDVWSVLFIFKDKAFGWSNSYSSLLAWQGFESPGRHTSVSESISRELSLNREDQSCMWAVPSHGLEHQME